jgi:hypothetical protein
MGIVNMMIGDGGAPLELTDSDETSRCLVSNLPPEIAKEYVEVILEDFPVKSIELIEPDKYETCPQAIVEFHTRKAFQDFETHYKNNMAR